MPVPKNKKKISAYDEDDEFEYSVRTEYDRFTPFPPSTAIVSSITEYDRYNKNNFAGKPYLNRAPKN